MNNSNLGSRRCFLAGSFLALPEKLFPRDAGEDEHGGATLLEIKKSFGDVYNVLYD